MKITLKWQIWCKPCTKRYYRFDGQGWHVFDFGLVKIKRIPPEGGMLRTSDYYGFIIKFSYWFPIDRA